VEDVKREKNKQAIKKAELWEDRRDWRFHALNVIHRNKNTLVFVQQNLNILNSLLYSSHSALHLDKENTFSQMQLNLSCL
jgi:hypothetical protein